MAAAIGPIRSAFRELSNQVKSHNDLELEQNLTARNVSIAICIRDIDKTSVTTHYLVCGIRALDPFSLGSKFESMFPPFRSQDIYDTPPLTPTADDSVDAFEYLSSWPDVIGGRRGGT